MPVTVPSRPSKGQTAARVLITGMPFCNRYDKDHPGNDDNHLATAIQEIADRL
jgi:hypothetical protein